MVNITSRRHVLIGGGGAVVAASTSALLLPPGKAAAQSVPLGGAMVQQHILTTDAPPTLSDLPFLDAQGKKYWTGDLLGKPTLYVLWASNCGVCLGHELPMLARAKSQIEGLGVRVLPIAMRYDTFPAMDRALRASVGNTNLGLFKMADSRMFNEIAPNVGLPRGTPSSAIADTRGRLRVISLGRALYDRPEGMDALRWVAAQG